MARAFVTGLSFNSTSTSPTKSQPSQPELHTTTAAVALASLAPRPVDHIVIFGPVTTDQLTAGLAGLAFELPEQTVTQLTAASQLTVVPPTNGQHHAA